MSLKVAHELGFAAAMVCGLLGLLMGQALPTWCWLTMLAVPLSAWQRLHDKSLSTALGSALGAAFFAAALYTMVTGGPGAALDSACLFLLGMVVARLLTRTYPSHDLQALVLSLLLMFAGTLMHQAFTYALVLVAYTVTSTWALLTRQLISGCTEAYFRHGNKAELDASLARRDVVTPRFSITVAALAWGILLATGALFLLFPRVGLGGLHLGQNSALLTDSISLSGSPRAQSSAQTVVRVRGLSAAAADAGLYLRGRIYDSLSNTGFARDPELPRVRPSRMAQVTSGSPLTYQVEAEATDGEHLLALGPVLHAVQGDGTGWAQDVAVQAPTGELVALEPLPGPLRLAVTGYNVPLRLVTQSPNDAALEFEDAVFDHHFLRLPDGLNIEVRKLAQAIVGDTPRFGDRALKLRRYLLDHFAYSLTQPNAGKADPLSSFLLNDRRGHCEYFAVAYAVLLRAVGVPSRVVGGFEGGTWDPADNTVLMSGQNAHAWVEWYLPGRGWVVDDATPPSDVAPISLTAQWLEQTRSLWEGAVMQFGLADQLALFKGATRNLGGALGTLDGLHPWTHSGTSRPRKAQAFTAAAVLAAALLICHAARRISRRRRGPALGRALLAAFARLGGSEPRSDAGYVEELARLQASGVLRSQDDLDVLRTAVHGYCRYRFGPKGPPPATGRLRRQLAGLRPKP